MTVFYLHWDELELKERIKALAPLKLDIQSHWSTRETVKWGETLPGIFVISLDRLPSHGRQYAAWLWEAKKRQHIPIIFVDGKPDKIEETKLKFPKAIYCSSSQLIGQVKKLAEAVK
jgi:hypothetical protein